jgi:hypothetical protein
MDIFSPWRVLVEEKATENSSEGLGDWQCFGLARLLLLVPKEGGARSVGLWRITSRLGGYSNKFWQSSMQGICGGHARMTTECVG